MAAGFGPAVHVACDRSYQFECMDVEIGSLIGLVRLCFGVPIAEFVGISVCFVLVVEFIRASSQSNPRDCTHSVAKRRQTNEKETAVRSRSRRHSQQPRADAAHTSTDSVVRTTIRYQVRHSDTSAQSSVSVVRVGTDGAARGSRNEAPPPLGKGLGAPPARARH